MRKKYFILILLGISIVVSIGVISDYFNYVNEREEKSIKIGQQTIYEITEEINEIIQRITKKGDNIASLLSEKEIKGGELLSLIRSESQAFRQILGVTVAYEPFMYDENIELFAPYFDKSQNQFIFIENVYDYTDPDLETSQWYTSVVENGPQWIEPYFAEGAQAMVADYGVPFYTQNEAGGKVIAGTVTLTISLKDFTRLLNSLSLGKTGYGFIISPTGKFVAHPISEYVGNQNIQDLTSKGQNAVMSSVGKRMLEGKSGFEQFENSISNQTSYLFYNHIPKANWGLGVVFIKNELLGNPFQLRIKLMHIGFSISLMVFFLSVLTLKPKRSNDRLLWHLSLIISFIIIANISFIWYLTLNYTFPDESNERIKITNTSTLNRFLNLEIQKASELRIGNPVIIPTGIYIKELEFKDSYNVNISASIWQLYNHRMTRDVKRAVSFPQTSPFAESLIIQKNVRDKKFYDLVSYEVRGTFRFDFDYSTYPFDFRKIDFIITHPDKSKNIILTPNLDSYKIINQTSKPGVNNEMVLPESKVSASFFDYQLKGYNENFGSDEFSRKSTPQLQFNMVLKRNFINAFVSNIIPILIVALMVYFLVYSSSKHATKRSDISSLGVVESSAAFFFVLILAHIDLRKTVTTPVITYMESFYFIMYFILGLVAFNIVMFTKRDNYMFFDFKDNLVVKLIYWPVFLGLCFILTLWKFY